MPHQEVKSFLESLPTSDRVRAAAWDAVYNITDDTAAENALRQLPIRDEMKAQLWDYRARTGSEAPEQPPDARKWLGDALGAFGEAMNPVTAIGALKQALTPAEAGGVGPNQTLHNIFDASAEQGSQASAAFKRGDYAEAAGRAGATVPVIGPAAAHAGERIGSGDIAGGIGEGAALVAGAGLAGPISRGIGKAIQAPARAGGRMLYQSALKPTKSVLNDVRVPVGAGEDAARQALVQTGLREQIPVSPAGVRKVTNLIDSLNAEVEARISAASKSGATVDPTAVEQKIAEVAKDFAQQVNAQPDIAAIETVRRNFMGNPSVAQTVNGPAGPATIAKDIPVDVAQRMKVNTYKGLRGKYGTERGATIEAEKAGARGLREGIEAAAPDVGPLNAREGSLFTLEEAIADAMRRRGNYGLFGLTPVVAAGASAASGSVLPLLASIVDRMPGVVSRTGIWMNRVGTRSGRLTQEAARAAATGNATNPTGRRIRTTTPAWSTP